MMNDDGRQQHYRNENTRLDGDEIRERKRVLDFGKKRKILTSSFQDSSKKAKEKKMANQQELRDGA